MEVSLLEIESILVVVDVHVGDLATLNQWEFIVWLHVVQVNDKDAEVAGVINKPKSQLFMHDEGLKLFFIV